MPSFINFGPPVLSENFTETCPKALTVIEIRLVWASLVYKTGRYTNILLINFISIDFKFGVFNVWVSLTQYPVEN